MVETAEGTGLLRHLPPAFQRALGAAECQEPWATDVTAWQAQKPEAAGCQVRHAGRRHLAPGT